MADFPLLVQKVVSSLPDVLTPHTIYLVRVGQGFDLYVTDSTGQIAHKINNNDLIINELQEKINFLENKMNQGKWLDNICLNGKEVITSSRKYMSAQYLLNRTLNLGDLVILRFKVTYDNGGNNNCFLRPYIAGQTPFSNITIRSANEEIFEAATKVATNNADNCFARFYSFPNTSANTATTTIHWLEVYVFQV